MYDPYSEKILNEKARFYCKKIWGLNFNISVKVNYRLRNTIGCFVSIAGEPSHIEIASHLLKGDYKETTVDSLLIHELTHWACDKMGKLNADNSSDFVEEVKKIGCCGSKEIKSAGKYYYCKCTNCGKIMLYRKTKKSALRYHKNPKITSKCCKSQLRFAGYKIIKDLYKADKKVVDLNNKFKQYRREKIAYEQLG